MLKWALDLKTNHKLYSVRLAHTPDDYYSWTFEQRRQVLQGHSTAALCKTIVMRNVFFNEDHPEDPTYSKYILVVS